MPVDRNPTELSRDIEHFDSLIDETEQKLSRLRHQKALLEDARVIYRLIREA